MSAMATPRATAVALLEGVTVMRGSRALVDDVSLELGGGEVVALVGANGAGKSTLLSVISGDTGPDRGRVLLNGRELRDIPLRDLAQCRAVLPQQTLLQFGFSGRDVVEMGRNPLPADRRRHDDIVVGQAMASTEIAHIAERSYPTMSGGEQMRVTLARVLAQEAPLLLLDEPTASLDIRHQHLVMEVAQAFAQHGATVLCILHDLNLALSYADRVAVMAQGRILACDVPDRIARADILESAFACPMYVMRHPRREAPMVLTLGIGAGSCFVPHINLPDWR